MATKEEEDRSMTVTQLVAFLNTCPGNAIISIEPMGALSGLEIAATTIVPRVYPRRPEVVFSIRVRPDEDRALRWMIQFQGTWGGQLTPGWRPAVTGTLNQTGTSDEMASTFGSWSEAVTVLDETIRPEAGDDEKNGVVKFRIITV